MHAFSHTHVPHARARALQDAAQEEGNTNNDGKQGGLFDARGNAVITISSMGVIQASHIPPPSHVM